MFALLLTCVLLTCGVWVWWRWQKVKRYWSVREVPHRPPNSVLGSLTFLLRENPAIWMRKIYEEFRAPYVGVWIFWRPALIINTPELARKILVKDTDYFRDRFLGSGKTDPIGGLNLFTVNDPTWTSMRRRLTSVFTAAKLRSLHNLITTKSADLVQRIKEENMKNKPINIRLILTDYTTDVIGEAAFGVLSEATKTGDSSMRKVTRSFMEFNIHRGLSWSSIFFMPELVDLFGFSFFPKATVQYLRGVFRAIVAQRGGYEAKRATDRDLLDALIRIKQQEKHYDDGVEITEDLLIAQAAIFLQAGFETSGAALTFALYELARLPDAQARLYSEISEAKQKNNNELDSTLLGELPFLNSVIKETLRKYPAMGWLDRKTARDYKLDEKLTIPAGTIVYVNAFGLHFDPQYFPDPHTFDPERFLPENETKMTPYTFMPFGDGPRNCIGMRFAYQTMRFAISALILNYHILPLPGSTEPRDVKFDVRNMLLMPGEILSVKFEPRN